MANRYPSALFVLCTVVSGCGWRYAGELESRPTVRSAPARPTAPESNVVASMPAPRASGPVVPGARDLTTLGQNHHASMGAAPVQMAEHAFEVRLVDAVNDARQLVHCSTGKIARFQKQPSSPALKARFEAEGRPLGVWHLEIDPTGRRTDLPNNAWYRHLRKYHRLEFVGRNRLSGTVIYRYLGPRAALSLRR